MAAEGFMLESMSVHSGQPIRLTFSKPVTSTPESQLWVTVVDPEADDEEYDDFVEVEDGATDVVIDAPSTPYVYEVRLHADYPAQDYNIVCRASVVVAIEKVVRVFALDELPVQALRKHLVPVPDALSGATCYIMHTSHEPAGALRECLGADQVKDGEALAELLRFLTNPWHAGSGFLHLELVEGLAPEGTSSTWAVGFCARATVDDVVTIFENDGFQVLRTDDLPETHASSLAIAVLHVLCARRLTPSWSGRPKDEEARAELAWRYLESWLTGPDRNADVGRVLQSARILPAPEDPGCLNRMARTFSAEEAPALETLRKCFDVRAAAKHTDKRFVRYRTTSIERSDDVPETLREPLVLAMKSWIQPGWFEDSLKLWLDEGGAPVQFTPESFAVRDLGHAFIPYLLDPEAEELTLIEMREQDREVWFVVAQGSNPMGFVFDSSCEWIFDIDDGWVVAHRAEEREEPAMVRRGLCLKALWVYAEDSQNVIDTRAAALAENPEEFDELFA